MDTCTVELGKHDKNVSCRLERSRDLRPNLHYWQRQKQIQG